MWPAHGTVWSHLVSDTSLAELHTFAAAAGLPPRAFDLDHYDVPASRYLDLQAQGALAVDAGTLLRRLRASGLRRSERSRIQERAALGAVWAALASGSPDDAGGSADESEAGIGVHEAAWAAVGDELVARWGEKGRIHHASAHLREVLDAIASLAVTEPVTPEELRAANLAAWFHDAVHSSGRRHDAPAPQEGESDEESSAALARRLLTGLTAPDVVAEVERLVLMTATHAPSPGDGAAALLSDADLAVLGAPAARYADYAAAIAVEYAHVPREAFRSGRAAILEQLLDGPLYLTPTGRALWEERARANLHAEVASLRA